MTSESFCAHQFFAQELPMGQSPIIGITMGDPAGIGPEIIVKALKDPVLPKVSSASIVAGSCEKDLIDIVDLLNIKI